MSPIIDISPDNMSAGNFLDDEDVILHNPRFAMFDFNHPENGEKPCFVVDVERTQGEAGKTYPQHWSCGDPQKFRPTKDGETPEREGPHLMSFGNSTGKIHKKSKFGYLINRLVELNLSTAQVEAISRCDLSWLDGMKVHMVSEDTGQTDPKGNPVVCLVPTEILVNTGAKAAKGAKAASSDGDGGDSEDALDLEGPTEAELVDLVAGYVNEQGSLSKKTLVTKLFVEPQTGHWKQEAADVVTKDAWLANKSRPWKYERGILSTK